MNKKIEINYNGEKYTLEYDRDVVIKIERAGLNVNEIASKPVSSMQMLFEGAFLKNHKRIKREDVLAIYDTIKNREQLNNALLEMYIDVYNSTVGDDDENDDSKNTEWKMA